jgi:enterochelin esterase-like enzyme
MAPNSDALVVVLILVAAAAFVLTVRFWSRLSGPGAGRLGSRAAALFGTQVAMLAAGAAVLNADFAFYTSWHDLFGTASGAVSASGPDTAQARNAGGVVPQALVISGRGGAPQLGGTDKTRFGEIDYVTVNGLRTGLSQSAQIYLPPQYFQAAYQKSQFPAVIVSAGFPGTPEELASRLRYPARLLDSITKGKAKPMILVMVSPSVVSGRDTECTDVPGGPQTESFWAQDLPTAVRGTYRVQADAKAWGLVGDSAGGYCALKIAMTDSDRFSAAASLSGYFDALQDHTTGTLYGGSQDVRNANDLMWRIKNLPSPPIAAWLTTSRSGEENYAPTMEFAGVAKAPMTVETVVQESGGHNFTTWDAEVQPALEWLSSHLEPVVADTVATKP